ncbi:hypothetical protein Poli38472_008982 [Pythium oligandrum]|uniref:Uncharacterized protein n=1 Tax=Pythium oligandrum TaxID=41045 RepID=A0A8K1FIB7_PYTOL|nr:hypothetical protein Poli38472_008982 [Pythium oligandrum]|eukprot:TMW64815.1 hypothetical protein Poli38472_008982 [Pythium oligandrum]
MESDNVTRVMAQWCLVPTTTTTTVKTVVETTRLAPKMLMLALMYALAQSDIPKRMVLPMACRLVAKSLPLPLQTLLVRFLWKLRVSQASPTPEQAKTKTKMTSAYEKTADAEVAALTVTMEVPQAVEDTQDAFAIQDIDMVPPTTEDEEQSHDVDGDGAGFYTMESSSPPVCVPCMVAVFNARRRLPGDPVVEVKPHKSCNRARVPARADALVLPLPLQVKPFSVGEGVSVVVDDDGVLSDAETEAETDVESDFESESKSKIDLEAADDAQAPLIRFLLDFDAARAATRTAYVAYATAKDHLKTTLGHGEDDGKRKRYPRESVRSMRLAVQRARQAHERALAWKETVMSDCPSWTSCDIGKDEDVNGYCKVAVPEQLVTLRYSILVALAEDRVEEARLVLDEAAEAVAVGAKPRRPSTARAMKTNKSVHCEKPRLALGARYCAFQRYLRARSVLDRAEDELHGYRSRLLPCRSIGEWV